MRKFLLPGSLCIVILILGGLVLFWPLAPLESEPAIGESNAIAPDFTQPGPEAGLVEARSMERAEPSAAPSVGLKFWQEHYSARLSAGTVTIRADDDWWYGDEEVMALFRARLQETLTSLEAKLVAWDARPRPWIKLDEIEGVDQPLGSILSGGDLDSPYLRYYESTLVAGDLARMVFHRKLAGLTPFALDRPILSIAEMSADPFAFPPEYFMQAFSNRVDDSAWMESQARETRRLWEAYSIERAALRSDYYNRISAIETTATELGLLWPHVSHRDDFLPGTSELEEQIRANEVEYVRELRQLALADGPPH